jgi:hypothetical protein
VDLKTPLNLKGQEGKFWLWRTLEDCWRTAIARLEYFATEGPLLEKKALAIASLVGGDP